MRWQCLNCNNLLGTVVFFEKPEIIQFAYCHICDKETLQTVSDKEKDNGQEKQPAEVR